MINGYRNKVPKIKKFIITKFIVLALYTNNNIVFSKQENVNRDELF